MKTIFIIGRNEDLSADQVLENALTAENCSLTLFNKGWNVIIPQKNFYNLERYSEMYPKLNYDFYLDCQCDLLLRSDAVFVLEEWEKTDSANILLDTAMRHNIPIFHEEDGYPTLQHLEDLEEDMEEDIV